MSDAKTRSPFPFFLLVFALSAPFWAVGGRRFLPESIPIDLPASALMTFIPMIAALILRYREDGLVGLRRLIRRAFDYRNIKDPVWYLPAILLMPAMMVLEYAVLRVMGVALPEPHIPILMVPLFVAMFFVGAIGEELGWQGYAFDRLHARWDALSAGAMLGLVWALWHVIPFIQTNHNSPWVVWQFLFTIVLRIVTVWLYINAGRSVFIAVVFHTMSNVSMFLFPNYGSHYNPFVTFVIMAAVVGVVTYLWGRKTLAQFRYARVNST